GRSGGPRIRRGGGDDRDPPAPRPLRPLRLPRPPRRAQRRAGVRDHALHRAAVRAMRSVRPRPKGRPVNITEPGIYEMSNEAYHAQEAWASSTGLKSLLPERYRTGGSQDALDFGTLFHTAVLEPDNLAEYVALDSEKIGLKSVATP